MFTHQKAEEILAILKDVDKKITFLESTLYFRSSGCIIKDLKHDHQLSNITRSKFSDLANDLEERIKDIKERVAKL